MLTNISFSIFTDEEIENFINQLDKEDRGHIGFTHFFRAIQNIIDPNEDPLPVYSAGERPRRPRSASWVAPQSVRFTYILHT